MNSQENHNILTSQRIALYKTGGIIKNEMNNRELKRPEFYHIPKIVAEKVNPHEAFIFSVIYWFHKMRDGRCFASNQAISEALPYESSNLSVANALLKLEKLGFIKRIFKDKNKRNREEIVCLVEYRVSSTGDTGIIHKLYDVSSTGEQSNNTEYINNNIYTPKEISEEFMNRGRVYDELREELINAIGVKMGVERATNLIDSELDKFIDYWTELNPTGKRQRWQMEKVFDVKRRVSTWLRNYSQYSKGRESKRSNGKQIIFAYEKD